MDLKRQFILLNTSLWQAVLLHSYLLHNKPDYFKCGQLKHLASVAS